MPRLVAPGAELERARGGEHIRRHHHEAPYAALILRGGYIEAGDHGRVEVTAGDVLFHDAFEGHCDCIGRTGADILNLPMVVASSYPLGRCIDPDAVARVAADDPGAASRLLIGLTTAAGIGFLDWPDLLAEMLRRDPQVRIDHWAASNGLRPTTVSRGFRAAYGTSAKRYRLELRAAAAARAIRRGAALSDAAFGAGFADQPHMTRAVGSTFGRSPATLRH